MNVDDQATQAEAHALSVALLNQKAQAKKETETLNTLSGNCLYCREELDKARRFCDKDCQEDFEQLSRSHSLRVR